MDRTEALKLIADDATRGNLVFPTSARLALKAKQMLDNPRCHIETASRLVQAEPLLAARTVALANSVVYKPKGHEITDVRSAIGRIGFATVRMLAGALVTHQMAGILRQPEQHVMATRLWEHTAHVAALARVIADRTACQAPETAMFAGIVHEVGNFYLLSRSADYPALLAPGATDRDEGSESAIGRAVLKALGVPVAVMEAIEHYWRGRLSPAPLALGDILLLADDLAPVDSPLHPARMGRAPADLGETGIDGQSLRILLQDSAEEVASLTEALRF